VTPNIGLTLKLFEMTLPLLLLRPGTIRINPAFDLRQSLLMLMNHRYYGNHATDDNGHNRYQ